MVGGVLPLRSSALTRALDLEPCESKARVPGRTSPQPGHGEGGSANARTAKGFDVVQVYRSVRDLSALCPSRLVECPSGRVAIARDVLAHFFRWSWMEPLKIIADMNETAPQLVPLSLARPEENLALDEALLLASERALAEGGEATDHEWLRLWESPRHFVVLGVSGKLRDEVFVDRCRKLGIPILRRASGGGTVLQGPGCLNFSLILSLRDRPHLRDLRASYHQILERTVSAFAPQAEVRGTSDLVIAGEDERREAVKFSGNAQKRSRHALLHHGTILYNLDIGLIERVLKAPPKQPDYRRDRPHKSFCHNLELPAERLKGAIADAWKARPIRFVPPDLTSLIDEKYGNPEWTERF